MNEHADRARPAHGSCWDLLPWLVNDTLNDAQRAEVQAHLEQCAECRREASEQRILHEHLRSEESVVYAPQPSLQKLLSRIDASPEPDQPAPVIRTGKSPTARWRPMQLLAATIVVGAIGVIMAGGISAWRLQDQRSAARYATLTTTIEASRTPAARVVFAPTMSVVQLGELLQQLDAQVIGGPSEAGVYTLVFSVSGESAQGPGSADTSAENRVTAAIQALRRNPGVLFAEPVIADAGAGMRR